MTYLIVETYQLKFRVFICAFYSEISLFFGLDFPLCFPIFGSRYENGYPVPVGIAGQRDVNVGSVPPGCGLGAELTSLPCKKK